MGFGQYGEKLIDRDDSIAFNEKSMKSEGDGQYRTSINDELDISQRDDDALGNGLGGGQYNKQA